MTSFCLPLSFRYLARLPESTAYDAGVKNIMSALKTMMVVVLVSISIVPF